jgi:predicted metal-dependent phosphoesterase TrpH
MLREFRADLHVHTCMSPCAELDISPRAIIKTCREKGLDIIGITDHNSAEHVLVTAALGAEAGVAVIGGMEVTSAEEVHLLVFFENAEESLTFQGYIYNHLPVEENNEQVFGFQPVVNKDDEILFFNKRLLIGATDLSVEQVLQRAQLLKGLVIASHIDREAFSMISQLGMVPDHLALDAVEISPHMGKAEALKTLPYRKTIPLITSSDAHALSDIGKRVARFLLQEPSFNEIKLALRGEQGRTILW